MVMATDPDCDRMGVAIRNAKGEMELLTGNQIGSLIAAYRVRKLIEQGVITAANADELRDHQDVRDDRSAKGDRREARPALRGDADRLQIHRGKARQLRGALPAAARAKYRNAHREGNPRAAPEAFDLLCRGRRGELRLQRARFRPRQGRKRGGGAFRRSRCLGEITRPDDRPSCSTRFTRSTDFTGRKTARSHSKAQMVQQRLRSWPRATRRRRRRQWTERRSPAPATSWQRPTRTSKVT